MSRVWALKQAGQPEISGFLRVRLVALTVLQPIQILIVEDHPVFRAGLSTIIGSQQDMVLLARRPTQRRR